MSQLAWNDSRVAYFIQKEIKMLNTMHRHYNENIQIQTSFVNIVSFLSTTSLTYFVLHHLIEDKKNLNKIK